MNLTNRRLLSISNADTCFVCLASKMAPRMAAVLCAPGKLCSFSYVLFVFLLFYVLDVVSITVYDKDTLLNIGSSVAQRKPDFEFLNAGGLFTDTASEPFVWIAQPRKRRQSRKRGKRAGVLVRLRLRDFRPPLPTILLANVQSLDNKLCELQSRISYQRETRDCCVICLTETWMSAMVPDSKQRLGCLFLYQQLLVHAWRSYTRPLLLPLLGCIQVPPPPTFRQIGSLFRTTLLLLPAYRQKLKREAPALRTIQCWSDQSDATLQDCFDHVDWDMFRAASDEDIEAYSDSVTCFIRKCIDDVVPTKTIHIYPNQKPWIYSDVRSALSARTSAFKSGNTDDRKQVSYDLRRSIKAAKRQYKTNLKNISTTTTQEACGRALTTSQALKGINQLL